MNITNMIPDDAEFHTRQAEELEEFLIEREETATWFSDETNAYAEKVSFSPIFAEPICVPSIVEALKQDGTNKFPSGQEAYATSMYLPDENLLGSSQLMTIGGQILPVGESAIRGLNERAGIKAEGWDKLRKKNPTALSNVLNEFFRATAGYVTVLVQDEKVRAVNSGRYAAYPATQLMDAVNTWIAEEYPDISFIEGYANHDYIYWHLDLSAYKDEILGAFPELKAEGFSPALTVSLSHTGTSSVSLIPALAFNDILFPIGAGLKTPHIGKGTFTERQMAMDAAVKAGLPQIFPTITDLAGRIEGMRTTQVNNAHSALLRGMKSLNLPKVQALEAAAQFEAMFGTGPTTAYDVYISIVDTMTYVMRDFPCDYRKQFAAAKAMERAVIGIDWAKLGDLPGSFSW